MKKADLMSAVKATYGYAWILVYNENISVLIPGDINMVVDPVLSYIVFGQQAGTPENVIKAALGHLTQEQICQAKDALWAKADSSIVRDHQRHRVSSKRLAKEPQVLISDVVGALGKLDAANKMPVVLIDAMSLGLIPRSHPEELRDISVVDRLNRLEQRAENMQGLLDNTVHCNGTCKHYKIYESTKRKGRWCVTWCPCIPWRDLEQSYARSLVVRLPRSVLDPQLTEVKVTVAGVHRADHRTRETETANRRDPSAVAQLIPQGMQQRGRGGGGRGSSCGAGRGASWSVTLRSASLLSLDRDSIATDRSNDRFVMPSYAMRNQRRKEKRQRQIVTGTGIETGSFAGAPEPLIATGCIRDRHHIVPL